MTATRAPALLALAALALSASFAPGRDASAQEIIRTFPGVGYGPLTTLGDLDGDGLIEFVTLTQDSTATLVSVVEVRSGANASTLWSAGTTDPFAGFGRCDGGGDANGDGVRDLIVGAPGHAGSSGAVVTFSGAGGAPLHAQIVGVAGSSLGYSVAGIGDLDGDGKGEIVAGAVTETTPGGARSGAVHVYSGATQVQRFRVDGSGADARFGQDVAAIGDCDGDGKADLAATAPQESNAGGSLAGSVRLCSGAAGQVRWTVTGQAADDALGWLVEAAGDVNADGVPDVIVAGLQSNGTSDGVVLVASGADGSTLHRVTGAWSVSGAIAGAGDLDGDGHADFAATDPSVGFGSVRAFSGATGAVLWSLAGSNVIGGLSGRLVKLGDANADGVSDLAISSDGTLSNPAGAMRVLTGTCGRAEMFGSGCPTSIGGMPVMTASGTTCLTPLGHGVRLRIDPTINPVSPPYGFVLVSAQEVAIPLPGGCTLLANPSPAVFITIPFVAGGFPFAFSLGPVPASLPLGTYVAQAFRPDPGLPRGYCATNGLRLVVE